MTLKVLSHSPGSQPPRRYRHGHASLPRAEEESGSGALGEAAASFCLSATGQSICHMSRMGVRLRCSLDPHTVPEWGGAVARWTQSFR